MRTVTREKKTAVLHRLDYEAAHWGDAFLQHHSLFKLARPAEPLVQFIPDTVVRPIFDVFIMVALQIEARERRRPHGVKREAPVGVGIDQLMIRWWAFRQDTEPAERIVALEHRQNRIGNTGPTDAVEAIASGDKIAVDLLR